MGKNFFDRVLVGDSDLRIAGGVLLCLTVCAFACYRYRREHAFREVSDALEGLMEEKKSTVQPTRISNEKKGDAEEGTSTELRGISIHSFHHRPNVVSPNVGSTATPLTPLLERKEEKNQNQCQQSASSSQPYSSH